MKSLEIKNYKNLKNFNIDSLSKVNLIVGKNNVGKSSLLEAISIYCSKGDVSQLKNILDLRGESVDFRRDMENQQNEELERFSSLFSDRNIESFFAESIEIKAFSQNKQLQEAGKLSIRFVRLIEKNEIDENGLERIVRKIVDENAKEELEDSNLQYGILSTFDNKSSLYILGRNLFRGRVEKLIPFEYVRTSQITNDRNPTLFDKIALTSLEKEIINALKIIEPNIEAINFLKDESKRQRLSSREDERVAIVVFGISPKRYRLSSMGDGVNRILTIILALLNCKDGILLIDEFENGLHYSVQTQLWNMIFKLSNQLNVQVFATTHSDDCIKSFIAADTNESGRLIRLENRGSQILAVEYEEKSELEYISTRNIEVR